MSDSVIIKHIHFFQTVSKINTTKKKVRLINTKNVALKNNYTPMTKTKLIKSFVRKMFYILLIKYYRR